LQRREATMARAGSEDRTPTIRLKVMQERERVTELNGKLGEDLKQVLKPALSQLDFAEKYFLDDKILKEQRTPAQLARWLGGAEMALKIAAQIREYVEGVAESHGANARVISG
jgi:hypothetical protein